MANERHKRDRYADWGINKGWDRRRFSSVTEWRIWGQAANGEMFGFLICVSNAEMDRLPNRSNVATRLRLARKQLREAIARNGGPLKTPV